MLSALTNMQSTFCRVFVDINATVDFSGTQGGEILDFLLIRLSISCQ